MRILLLAATALTLTGSALAYQTDQTTIDTAIAPTIALDPTVAITPPTAWTDEQRTLWEQHMAALPASWTAEERAAFQALMLAPPVNWTAEQRVLYETHMASLPASWTPEQRAAYELQIADLRSPWLGVRQTASVDPTATTTLAAAAPAGPRIVQPSNADPERDARGIAVISDPAVVPDGYNGHSGTGMGGPLVDPSTGEAIQAADANYPPCTASVTDNCIQLYERGVRDQAGMGGPEEPVEPGSATTQPSSSTGTTPDSSTTPHQDHSTTQPEPTTQPDY